MTGFPYVTDEAAFADRQRRMHEALNGSVLSAGTLSSILREVDPLPWVVGRWYRLTVIGADPAVRHVHGTDETGQEHALDLLWGTGYRRMEIEASPLMRQPALPGYGHVPAMTFTLRDGRSALFHEIDLLAAEEA